MAEKNINNMENLKDRRIDEELLENVSGGEGEPDESGRDYEKFLKLHGDAKKYQGDLYRTLKKMKAAKK